MCARECVRDLAARTNENRSSGSFPPVLYFTLSSADSTRDFFARFDESARAIADPTKFFYSAFGIERGGVGAFLTLRAVAAALRAIAKGNGVGRIDGDMRAMSGFVLARGDRVTWRHASRYMGDHPDWDEVQRLSAASAS